MPECSIRGPFDTELLSFFPGLTSLRFLDLYLGCSGMRRRPLYSKFYLMRRHHRRSCYCYTTATVIPNKNSFVSGSAHRAQTHHMLRQNKRCVKRRPVERCWCCSRVSDIDAN